MKNVFSPRPVMDDITIMRGIYQGYDDELRQGVVMWYILNLRTLGDKRKNYGARGQHIY